MRARVHIGEPCRVYIRRSTERDRALTAQFALRFGVVFQRGRPTGPEIFETVGDENILGDKRAIRPNSRLRRARNDWND